MNACPFQLPRLLALSGETLTTPPDTVEAYWSALAAGADGLALTVRLTADRVPVCIASAELPATTGEPRTVDQATMAEIRRLDAGAHFRSTMLDASNHPTGEYGSDFPWRATTETQRKLSHPTLQDTLRIFGRRCDLLLLLPDQLSCDDIIQALSTVNAAGLSTRVTVGGKALQVAQIPREMQRALVTAPDLQALDEAASLGVHFIITPFKTLFSEEPANVREFMIAMEDAKLSLLLSFDASMPAPLSAFTDQFPRYPHIAGLIAPGVLATAEALRPPALIFQDDFAGTVINRDLWTAGYSHANQDTVVYQQNGFHIKMQAGGSYSGGAAVCRIPIHGQFDAQVCFHAENPLQGTTLEVAAISIDPGAFHVTNDDLDSRSVNLTFDVHGAPPYASSECDEDNGFRCGWNNGFNLTRIDPSWSASSANMYNKYGRNVGRQSPPAKDGALRLMRNGSVFASYYRDGNNTAWVNSGAMLVHNLADDIFVRLAAKHWKKANSEPPSNHVVFYDFCLYQR
jgi:hypothetical protein